MVLPVLYRLFDVTILLSSYSSTPSLYTRPVEPGTTAISPLGDTRETRRCTVYPYHTGDKITHTPWKEFRIRVRTFEFLFSADGRSTQNTTKKWRRCESIWSRSFRIGTPLRVCIPSSPLLRENQLGNSSERGCVLSYHP